MRLLPSVLNFPRCSALLAPLAILGAATSFGIAASEPKPADGANSPAVDFVRNLQNEAVTKEVSPLGHWGPDAGKYISWSSHSLRMVPVYTFGTLDAGPGIDLTSYLGANSPYRSEQRVRELYGRLPTNTVNPEADYADQTNIADLQRAAVTAGKKHIFLVVFDGMDWQTTRLAAIYRQQKILYDRGRGTGLHFLDYTAGGTTQFGWMVTATHNEGTNGDPNTQTVANPGGTQFGGYHALKAGPNPWTPGSDVHYPIGKAEKGEGEHAYPDSAPTAAAMTTGVKSYNGAINVDATGAKLITIAHERQEAGWSVGAVSSVPISHATPAASYAHNVSRDDYQDLSRDLLGLKSVSHPEHPLPGLDVLIGAGYGTESKNDKGQGSNFVPGNRYLADADRAAVDRKNGGKYTVVTRAPGVIGRESLNAAADAAIETGTRLFGYFGVPKTAHLPFRTADGDYHPAMGRSKKAESYTSEDVTENPTLADMTAAAIKVLSQNRKGFWLLVEPGDVDWANHDNNIDNSIGAVLSGDDAVRVITDRVDTHSNWRESLLIVTADHGHYFIIDHPEMLIAPQPAAAASE